jgi:hypothetical protein
MVNKIKSFTTEYSTNVRLKKNRNKIEERTDYMAFEIGRTSCLYMMAKNRSVQVHADYLHVPSFLANV